MILTSVVNLLLSHLHAAVAGTAGTAQTASNFQRRRANQPSNFDVPIDYSLREYTSILYLEPRMKIFIRGKKVRTTRLLKSVSRRIAVRYQPRDPKAVSDKPFVITFGFQSRQKEHLYGIMLYHHNRLIKPYFRVGVQLQPNKDGMGVLGIMEADFLQPTHNKQDFDDTKGWRNLLHSLSEKLNKYWYEEQAKIEAEKNHIRTKPKKPRVWCPLR
eukprot:SAG31_NODE_1937_length_6866_cov_3.173932_6_plen_215_part_00